MKIAFLLLFLLLQGPLSAQDISSKAQAFLKTLPSDLKAQTQFDLDHEERFNMNFVPLVRKGPTFHDFNEVQKEKALELLRACLSQEGYRKASEIMELEGVLAIIENNNYKMSDGRLMRDPLNYHFCIFGDPSQDEFWGWRFEGHHLSLNFVAAEGKIVSSTPSFWGANPGVVKETALKGKQVLKQETELGFALVNSLTDGQLREARFSNSAPREIITGTQRRVETLSPKGISYTALSKDQREAFMKLLNVYIENYQFGFSEMLREKIESEGIENLFFAWAGGLKPGIGHYYRIQGPMLLIEYDNTQNNANHVHTVVRDLTNDYAEDILKEHYQRDHKQ